MTRPNSYLFQKIALTFLVVGSFSMPVSCTNAQENTFDIFPNETTDGNVELTPGYIAGEVDIRGRNITGIALKAKGDFHADKLYPKAEVQYSITVNVPAGESAAYNAPSVIRMGNWNTKMFFRDKSTVVNEGQTSQVDFVVNSGYINGEIIPNGCTLNKSEQRAIVDTETGDSHATGKIGSGYHIRFPAQPNKNIRVYEQTQLSTGVTINQENQYIDISSPGENSMELLLRGYNHSIIYERRFPGLSAQHYRPQSYFFDHIPVFSTTSPVFSITPPALPTASPALPYPPTTCRQSIRRIQPAEREVAHSTLLNTDIIRHHSCT